MFSARSRKVSAVSRSAAPYSSQPCPADVVAPHTKTLPFIAAVVITACKPLDVVNSYLTRVQRLIKDCWYSRRGENGAALQDFWLAVEGAVEGRAARYGFPLPQIQRGAEPTLWRAVGVALVLGATSLACRPGSSEDAGQRNGQRHLRAVVPVRLRSSDC